MVYRIIRYVIALLVGIMGYMLTNNFMPLLSPMIDYRLHAIIKEAGFLPYLSTLTGEEENG